MANHPLLRLLPRADRRLRAGYPWAFSNEIAMTPEHRAWQPGAPVRLESAEGWRYGTFAFNPHSLIAGRLLDRDPTVAIDAGFVCARIADAAALRARVCDRPFHRLVHAEADRLPGLIIDRFGDVAVVQANAAAVDRLLPEITAALTRQLPLRAVVARNDSAARAQEGLPLMVQLLHGDAADVEVIEGDVRFPIDPLEGQKTGFFLDQRPNRDRIAALASGARVLDVYCHSGAFGLRAAASGAVAVTLVDSSGPALERARQAAERNGLLDQVSILRGDAFDTMVMLADAGERYDIVVCDPPAFAKSRKDATAGLRAYNRMARLAARLVVPGGFLFVASCSHHASLEAFTGTVAAALVSARREARVLFTGGAGLDHPVHPNLPESAYLKAQLLQLS
jgi:23S rRNA (cytosine1962-C5)-methyltransferase